MDGKRAVLALVTAFVVACGGAAPATTGGATATSGAPTGTAATAATGGGAATPASNQPKFSDLLAASKVSQYKVTYKITATGAGAEALSGEQTWYFKPPRSRFDFSSNVGGQTTTISFFSLPDGTYYCFGAGGTSQCFSVAGVGSPLDQNAAAMVQRSLIDNPGQVGATFKESRTIAGQQGLCYDVTGSAAAGFSTGTFCYSKEGLALLSQFGAQGSTWSMEATQLSTTVADSDFTLPAKPLGR